MKLRGITSVLAAGVAVSLVWLVGASGEEPALEAVPAAGMMQAPPAPGANRAYDTVRDAFGDDFVDPLGVEYSLAPDGDLPAPDREFLTFDPYNAPTPEVIQPDGNTDAAVVVPLPTAPATIATASVEAVEAVEGKKGAHLAQPVKGRSTSRFGMRFHPVLRVYKLHTGHDWAAPCGTPVGAAAAGTVVRTGWAGGNGVQVKIDHGTINGYRVVTTYNHLSSIGVKVGQQVDSLQGVGRVGNTGYSTGCHLHFELIVNGQFTDPIPWLNGESTVVDLTKMDNVIVPTTSPQPTIPPSTDSPQPTLPSLPVSPSGSPSVSPTETGSPTPGTESPTQSPSTPGSPSGSPTDEPSSSGSPSATPTDPTPEPSGSESPTPDPTTDPTSPTPEPTTDPTTPNPDPTPKPEPTTSSPAPDPTTPPPSPTAPPSSTAPPPSDTAPPSSDPAPAPTQSASTPAADPAPSPSE